MKVIVIGNGPGGSSIASKLDARGCEVEQYSDEAVGFYSRIKLPSALGSVEKLEALCSKTVPHYLHHSSVVAIHKESKLVLLSSGETSTYDKLVLATGSNARKFYTDSGLKNIHTLRTYHDGIQITKSLKEPVVVLGGGLLGLETALAINTLGYKVCVVEGGAHLLTRQLNTEAANMVEEKCKQRDNFDITCGVFASKVDGIENIESLTLQDGNVLSCNTLIVAAGVIPSTSLAKNCGLKIDRAIVVDSRCKTSDTDIYAIGDCAQYNGSCPGMMPIALAMAYTASLDIIGEGIDYQEPKQMPARFVVDDMKISAFGEKRGQCLSKRKGDIYEAWYIEDKKVVGVLLVGSTIHLPLAKKMLGKEVEDTSLFLDF
jgi:nitrite reductase (NADH) large subunit